MPTRRFVCLAAGAAVFAAVLPAAAERARPAAAVVLTAKRLVCTAVRVRVCVRDGTCKPERVPSGPLVVDFT